MAQVRQCAGCLPLLLVTDGFAAYATALRKVFRDPVERTGRGRRRLQTWAGLCCAQVIKRYEQRRVVAVKGGLSTVTRSKWKSYVTNLATAAAS